MAPHVTPPSRQRLGGLAGTLLGVLAGASLLMGVVALNGRPVVFADSNIYTWMGQMQFRPLAYALGPVIDGPSSAAEDTDTADETAEEMQMRRTEMAARSPWFGMMLYGLEEMGSLWLFSAVQAVAASLVLLILWRASRPQGKATSSLLGDIVLMGGLCLTSTLPFFVGFAMPDLWSGLGLCALSCLLFFNDRLGRWSRISLGVVLCLAMSFHSTNILVASLATGLALVVTILLRQRLKRLVPGLIGLVGAVVLALTLNASYAAAIRAATGETILPPPFLVARVLADGPGRTYLRKACAEHQPWALCQFKDNALTDSQDILWSGDPHKGVFGLSDAQTRRAIYAQQNSFVLHAIASDPAGQLAASWRNFTLELRQVSLDDPLRDPHFYLTDKDWSDTFIADMVHKMADCAPNQTGCKPRFDANQSALWHGIWFAVAVLIIAFVWLRRDTAVRVVRQNLWLAVAFLLSALFINAAVTGVLSGPFARYQARISWLAPLCAILVIAEVVTRIRSARALGLDHRAG
jgi:hypothetical protein